ncbi:hypothetical protein EOY42_25790 [Salmonella enterica]|nr:hypothetical protein [Salmonella enterica]EBD7602234.1 hypothetical protein [Salmonella enterica]
MGGEWLFPGESPVIRLFKVAIVRHPSGLNATKKLSLYIELCNYLNLICSIQYQKQVNLWTKNNCRPWLTN